jgi:alkylhydroperoxidase family enzyme
MVGEGEAGALAGVYREIRSRLGLVPNVFKAMAGVNHDVLLQNWTSFRETVLEGILPRALKEMIGLVVARDLGGEYAASLHAHNLRSLGVGRGVVRCLLESGDCPEIPAADRLVLDFARAYTRDPDHTPADDLTALGLSEEQAMEVMDTVLIVAGINRFALECSLPADA